MDSIDEHWGRDRPRIELHLHLEGSMSISTDDPGGFATALDTELGIAVRLFDLDRAGVVSPQRAALHASFADDSVAGRISDELESVGVEP